MEKILDIGELAIIIPVLNCLDYTKAMLPTIKTKHPYKLILIDNGSTDGTWKFFVKQQKNYNVFAARFIDNYGVSAAWNYGIRKAIDTYNSQYFFIPNNDVLLHPETIDVLIDTLAFPDVVLSTATNISGRVASPEDVLGLKRPSKKKLKPAPDFSCFMLSKEAIDKVGYFDERFFPAYFEDNDYHYRIKLAGLKASKTNQSLYFHYGSRTIKNNEEVRNKSNLGYIANRNYYKEKWGGRPGKERFIKPFNK